MVSFFSFFEFTVFSLAYISSRINTVHDKFVIHETSPFFFVFSKGPIENFCLKEKGKFIGKSMYVSQSHI